MDVLSHFISALAKENHALVFFYYLRMPVLKFDAQRSIIVNKKLVTYLSTPLREEGSTMPLICRRFESVGYSLLLSGK